MPITDDSRPGAVMVRRQWGSVSMRPDRGIDEIGLVVLPPGLVLLGAPVMVDGEQGRPRGLGCRAQVDGRLPAPGADLDEGRRRGRRDGRPGRRAGRRRTAPRPRRRA